MSADIYASEAVADQPGRLQWIHIVAFCFAVPAFLFLAAIAGVLIADVFARQILNSPIRGASELVEFLAYGAVMFGLPAACARWEFCGGLGPAGRPSLPEILLRILVAILIIGVLALACRAAIIRFEQMQEVAEVSLVLEWPQAIKAGSIAIGFAAAAVMVVVSLIDAIIKAFRDD